jgi:glycosyltransferase involved in cell wall biosynthesis
MNICFVVDNFSPKVGGPYTAIKDITQQLKKLEIKYVIVNKKNFLSKKKNLKNYDIFHIFGGWSLFYIRLSILASRMKKKVIIHPMGFYESWSLSQKKIKKFFAWKLYQERFLLNANLIHCASKNEKKNLLKLNSNFKTVVLPFGVNDNFIKKKIVKKLNKKVLFFSRLHHKKGLAELIYAWQKIGNSDWTLDIIGDGDNNAYFKRLVNNKNVKINFLNPIYRNIDKIKVFNKYDFFVLPTKNENFGISILESLSRGLPVLTTNNTPWTIIRAYNAGWIINNIETKLRLNLAKIFEMNSNDFFIKSKNAVKLAKRFTWSKIFKKDYMTVYKKILDS